VQSGTGPGAEQSGPGRGVCKGLRPQTCHSGLLKLGASRQRRPVLGFYALVRRRWAAIGSAHPFGKTGEMMGGVAKQMLDHHDAPEIVADGIFLGHADAAMQLDRIL
jgi:hypothetical protein